MSGPSIYLTITFNYRGAITSMPWPVWSSKFSLLSQSKLCPVDCDWMLVEAATDGVGQAPELPEAEKEQPWWGKQVSEYSAGHVLVQSAQSAISLVKLAAIAGGAYLLWQLLSTTRGLHAIGGGSSRKLASRILVDDDDVDPPRRSMVRGLKR